MKTKLSLIAALLLASTGAVKAVNFTFNAAVSSGFALQDGTDLAVGSLLRFGTFSPDVQIAANANNYAVLNAAFTEIATATIGQGDPGVFGSASDTGNAGLFIADASAIDTSVTGLNIAGLHLYYWVFNAATADAATQQGIFSSTLWIIPDGNVFQNLPLDTDIVDLTTGQGGATLAGSAVIPIGSFGPGVNTTGYAANGNTGAVEFNLALIAIPEPAQIAGLFGVLALLGAFVRRRLIG